MSVDPDLQLPYRDGTGGTLYLPKTFKYGWALPSVNSRGQQWLPFQSGVYKQTYKHLKSTQKPVEPCLAALTIHGQQRGINTRFAGHEWASPKLHKATLISVPLWLKCERSLEMLLGSPCWDWTEGNSVWTAVLFGAPTHTLVLSYYTWFTVKGPLPLHGAVIFEQSEVCPSTGNLSPQSQPIKVAARWLQLCHWTQELVPFVLWQSGFVSYKVHCTGQRKHSHSMHFW